MQSGGGTFASEFKILEVSAIRTKYLDNCAQDYFERVVIKHRMAFVKAFSSMDHVRKFLNSTNLVDDCRV